MNILHIITGLPVGGAQIVLYNLLSHTAILKINNQVISLMDRGSIGERIADLGVPMHAVGINPRLPGLKNLMQFYRIIKNLPCHDLIMGWDYHSNFAASFAARVMNGNTRVIWSIHHTPHNLIRERFLTAAMIRLGGIFSRRVEKIIYVSMTSKKRHELLGYSSRNGVLIPNGYDLSHFKPSINKKLSVHSEFGIDHETILIGMIARFHPMKDHLNFIKAAELISRSCADVHFLLAGDQVDIQNNLLTDWIAGRNLGAKFHLLGERQDADRLIASLDILTVASCWGEACPMVIGEAMACGVPCVVTDVGDAGRLVGDTGYVVPPRNPEALAQAWNNLLNLQEDERRQLGMLARQRINDHFSLASMVRLYEQLYLDIVKGKL